ncbi:MAG TPA: helix-turn-helix domain-containing protein [Dermatophilaceae bacterium]|nr:helix-turn-helix domain-containing protein [Dermatophilaceae bacterium]
MQPQNARSRRTRVALLEAAREIVEERGLPALTMGAVAELAGVTRRSVYLRFESRTHLLTALFDHVNDSEALAASVRPVRNAPDAAAAIQAWAAHVARFHPRVLRIARAVQSMKDTDPDAAEHWRLVQDDWHRLCRLVARRMDAEKALASGWTVQTMADMLHALMSLDVLEILIDQRGWSSDDIAAHLARLAQSTFAARG